MSEKLPSREYLQHLDCYKQMHKNGFDLMSGNRRNSHEAYNGQSTLAFAKLIRDIIKKNQIKTLLDYGCGKGFFYDNELNIGDQNLKSLRSYWDIKIDLYDPCYEKHSQLDEKKLYDMVMSIDVLEHIPSQDIDWVLERIISKANKYVFINVACYSAVALLPTGNNAHITVKSPEWWNQKILLLKKKYKNTKIICVCTLKNNNKREYFPLQYDDKISNYEK